MASFATLFFFSWMVLAKEQFFLRLTLTRTTEIKLTSEMWVRQEGGWRMSLSEVIRVQRPFKRSMGFDWRIVFSLLIMFNSNTRASDLIWGRFWWSMTLTHIWQATLFIAGMALTEGRTLSDGCLEFKEKFWQYTMASTRVGNFISRCNNSPTKAHNKLWSVQCCSALDMDKPVASFYIKESKLHFIMLMKWDNMNYTIWESASSSSQLLLAA